ncbi:type I-E CRISPR-associated protein Cas6/Cse3/CasE [Microbacterium sp. BWT-B31]|uniref:type I-E CRISPR-associated protein Cas6/Cse3/CasE n=1 Tax=Microbacterium sp. BWT-B31 TaxID=3232072 RepID=UPI0035276B35
MFLSRVQLNPNRRAGRPLFESSHVLHAAVMAAFPDASARPEGRVLWRLDLSQTVGNVYIVSPQRPDLTALAEQGGWPTLPETQQVREYGPLLERVEQGHRYAFRLTANPTRSSRVEESRRGKVYGHVTARQQEEWLLRRQEAAGFTVARALAVESAADGEIPAALDLVVSDRRTLTFSRRETRVTLRVATFEGTLTVTDREAFKRTLTHGIGRAKSYGCGLMTIAPDW